MPESILIIGKSKVGQSLAKAIKASKKYKLAGIYPARAKRFPELDADVFIIATKDDKIGEISRKVLARAKQLPKMIIHLAGSLPATVLPQIPDIRRLTLHPLQTFAEPNAKLLDGIYWMASSDDAAAIRWAKKFASEMDAKGMFILTGDQLPLYHAMTVFSSNFITLLFSAIEEISTAIEQSPKKMKEALRPLAEMALQNALLHPATSVLSGPIARKDLATIRKHKDALLHLDPKIKKIYDAYVNFALP